MCPSSAVRNWLIAAMVALGGAISSVGLAAYWQIFYFGLFLAAASWLAAALVAMGFYVNALNTFCSCAARHPSCRKTCADLGSTKFATIAALWVAMGALLFALGTGLHPAVFLVFAGGAGIAMFSMITALVSVVSELGICQTVD